MLLADFLGPDTVTLGDSLMVGLKNLRGSNDALLSVKKAVVSVFDSSGTELLTNAVLTLSEDFTGAYTYTAKGLLRTGAGFPITALGYYRAVYDVQLQDLTEKQWQQTILVNASPY